MHDIFTLLTHIELRFAGGRPDTLIETEVMAFPGGIQLLTWQ